MGAFNQYTVMFAVIIFGVTAITSFSGSMFSTYDVDVESETLETIKTSAEDAQPGVSDQRNRTGSISPDEGSFLSPQGWGVIGDTISSAANLYNLVSTVERELGLPGFIGGFVIALVTLRLIWAGVSALFSWEL